VRAVGLRGPAERVDRLLAELRLRYAATRVTVSFFGGCGAAAPASGSAATVSFAGGRAGSVLVAAPLVLRPSPSATRWAVGRARGLVRRR